MELKLRPGQTESLALAEIVTEGTVGCSATLIDFTKGQHDGLSLTEVAQTLRAQGDAVAGGDLSDAERMLNAQAVALNAIFNELARRAATNMGTYLETTERYLRLAMKAQAQCRATVEALAEMKNPRAVAFVRQANIAHGNQQVNNGAYPAQHSSSHVPESTPTQSRPIEGSVGTQALGRPDGLAGGATTPVPAHRGEMQPPHQRSGSSGATQSGGGTGGG